MIFRDGTSTKTYLKDFAYVVWGFAILYLLIVLCLFHSIKIATAILKASAAFLSSNMHAILIPVMSLMFTMGFTAFWVYVSVYLVSAGEI